MQHRVGRADQIREHSGLVFTLWRGFLKPPELLVRLGFAAGEYFHVSFLLEFASRTSVTLYDQSRLSRGESFPMCNLRWSVLPYMACTACHGKFPCTSKLTDKHRPKVVPAARSIRTQSR